MCLRLTHACSRRLRAVKHAMATDGKFVFATGPPSRPMPDGSRRTAWLCECHRVTIYDDGRADLYALPAATVELVVCPSIAP